MKARDDGKAYAEDVSIEEFVGFLREFDKDKAGCRYCGAKAMDIPSHNGKPVVLNLPTPLHHEAGINAFYTSCSRCGSVNTFLAQTVVSRLMGWD